MSEVRKGPFFLHQLKHRVVLLCKAKQILVYTTRRVNAILNVQPIESTGDSWTALEWGYASEGGGFFHFGDRCEDVEPIRSLKKALSRASKNENLADCLLSRKNGMRRLERLQTCERCCDSPTLYRGVYIAA